jgi:Ca-activated chloride channel homolog
MSFLSPEMLWLMAILPILVVIYVLLQRRRKKYALRFASISILKEAMGKGPGVRRHIPPVLFMAGLTFMAIALARPAASVMMPSQRGTVILTIDCSGSMRADDLKPSRLEAAKSAARSFVDKQPTNVNIGVVSFSETASVVQAPTMDREAILAAVNRLGIQRRTAIGSAVVTSLEAIFEGPGGNTLPIGNDILGGPEPTPTFTPLPRGTYAPAVIVLLTDGVSNTGPRPLEVTHEAADRGVRIYTVGVGSNQGAVVNYSGYGMIVRLDEDTLKRIAERTGGEYFKAGSETDLHRIYDDLSTRLVFTPEKTELTVFFTGSAVVLMLIAGVVSLLWFNRLP